jgi:asparagine N-glycosylation enzyme membrane subunit Stt3
MALTGITGLQVVLTLLAASFGGILLFAARAYRRFGPWGRLGQVALAALLPAAIALVALPAARDGIGHGLAALAATNPWYPQVLEFRPLLIPGPDSIPARTLGLLKEFGIAPVLMVLAVPGLARRWARRSGERAEVLLLLVLGGALLALALARIRFILYLSVPIVLLSAAFASQARTPLSRRIPLIAFALMPGVLVAQAALGQAVVHSFVDEELIGALQWLRGRPPAAPEAESVLARWVWGHAVQYYARKPVLVSPFGTDAGREAMEDEAAFFFAQTAAEARAVLARRRIGFLLLDDPIFAAAHSLGFAPAGAAQAATVAYHWLDGERIEPTAAYRDLIAARLHSFDGLPQAGSEVPALAGYRLLYESPPRKPIRWISEGRFKVFGVVPGATLAVAPVPPGTPVSVSVEVRTNQGRAFTWTASNQAGATGVAVLRVPYATGQNGAVTAGPALVSDPTARREVVLPAAAVERGERLEVVLPR